MAEIQPPWAVDGGGNHPARELRRLVGALANGYTGIVGSGDLAVTAQGTPDRSVNVAAGGVLIPATAAGLVGPFFGYNDGTVIVNIAVGDATNPRRDIVVAKYDDVTKLWSIVAVQGAPAASPVDPTLPDNSVPLARLLIQIPPNDTVAGGDITNLRGQGYGADTAWTAPALSGAWAAFTTVGYRKTGREVRVRGVATGGAGTIFPLPASCWPEQTVYHVTIGTGAIALVSVSTAGVVALSSGPNGNVVLDGLTFLARP